MKAGRRDQNNSKLRQAPLMSKCNLTHPIMPRWLPNREVICEPQRAGISHGKSISCIRAVICCKKDCLYKAYDNTIMPRTTSRKDFIVKSRPNSNQIRFYGLWAIWTDVDD